MEVSCSNQGTECDEARAKNAKVEFGDGPPLRLGLQYDYSEGHN